MIRQLFCLDKGGLYDLRNFAVHNDTVIVTGKGYVYKNYEAKGKAVLLPNLPPPLASQLLRQAVMLTPHALPSPRLLMSGGLVTFPSHV